MTENPSYLGNYVTADIRMVPAVGQTIPSLAARCCEFFGRLIEPLLFRADWSYAALRLGLVVRRLYATTALDNRFGICCLSWRSCLFTCPKQCHRALPIGLPVASSRNEL